MQAMHTYDSHSILCTNENPRISTTVIAACMDRTSTLNIAIRSWLSVVDITEVILVDWSSEPSVLDEISDLLQDSRLKIITVQGEKQWVLSWAYNLAASFVSHRSLMLKVDCDTVLAPDFLAVHPLRPGMFYAGNWKLAATENARHLNGIFYVHSRYFKAVHGFDERIQTYGYDDTDLYQRLNATLLTLTPIDTNKVYHLDHPNDLRSSKQYINDVAFEIEKNRLLQNFVPAWNNSSRRVSFKIQEDAHLKNHYLARRISSIPSTEAIVPKYTRNYVKRRAAQAILRSYHVPWKSLHVPTSYMIRMIPSYKMNKMLIVHVQYSLEHRLLAMASGMAISNKTGRHFRLIWIPDSYCNVRFQQLFSNSIDVWDQFHSNEISADNFDRYNYMEPENGAIKDKLIITDSLNHIYVKTAYILNHEQGNRRNIQEALSQLVLHDSIIPIVDSVDITMTIGVHINIDMRVKILNSSIDRSNQYLSKRHTTLTLMFESQISHILEKYPEQRFFLSTDSEIIVREFHNKYKDNIIFIEKNISSIERKSSIYKTVANLWLLSRTQELLGTPFSYFSELVGLLGNITIKYAEIHFPNLLTDQQSKSNITKQQQQQGIIYIPNNRSNRELFDSIRSLQYFHKNTIPIAIFSDNTIDFKRFELNLSNSIHHINISSTLDGESIEDILTNMSTQKKQEIMHTLVKIQQLAKSPFDITLYIDTNTWFCHKIDNFDKILGKNDIMFSKNVHVKANSRWSWSSSVILYRNTPLVKRFFRLWEKSYLRECITSRVNSRDTCALTLTLRWFPLLRYGVLDSIYNFHLGYENEDSSNRKSEKLRSQLVRWPVTIFHNSKGIKSRPNETCRIVNERQLVSRVLGLTSSNQPRMYYSRADCIEGTKNNCNVMF